MSLTGSQEAAVRAEASSVCVSAGAGSGKTRVLTERFLDLVLRRAVPLERILALTFTDKAAGEMKARIAAGFRDRGPAELRREAERGFVSTIHAHCALLLRERALEAGVDPGFRVLDEIEAEDLLRGSVLGALEGLRREDAAAAAAVLRLAPGDLAGDVADLYERVRATDLEVAALSLRRGPAPASPADDEAVALFPHLRALLVRVDAVYGRAKAALGALDFSDLERRALALLRRRPAERTFDHVLVDELQDTNGVQQRLLEQLRGAASLFAVGDVKQSIYRFRNAEARVMTGLWESAGPEGQHALRETFRSRAELVRFFDAFFPRLFSGVRAGDVVFENVAAKTAYDPLPPGTAAVELLRLPAGMPAERLRREEAAQLAHRIAALVEGRERLRGHPASERRGMHLGYGDVAVLFRSLRDLKVYERAFTLQGVPYHVVRGRGFHATEEVEDALNVLRLLEEPEDARALAAFLTSPMVGLTDAELLRVFLRARESGLAPREYLESAPGDRSLPAPLRRRLRRVRRLLGRLEERRRAGEIHHLVRAIVEETRSDLTALMQDGGPRRLFNLEKLVALARERDRDGRASSADFLRAMAERRERDVPEMEAVTAGEEGDVVRLMTVHAAKGLEFPVVVVPDLGRAPNRTPPRFLYDRAGGIAFKVPDEDGDEAQATGGWRAVRDEEVRAEDQESARILYVAMTRAEELLILSGGRTKQSGVGTWLAWLEEFRASDPAAAGATMRVVEVAGEPRRGGLRKALKRRHGGELLRGAPLPEPLPEAVRRRAATLRARTPPRPEPRDRTPYVAAVSDVVRFAACPLACRFRTVLGAEAWAPAVDEAPDESVAGADDFLTTPDGRAWGNALHRLLETCDLDRGVTAAAAEGALRLELGREAREGEAAAAVEEVTRFLRSEAGLRARAAGGARVRRERPFLMRLEGVLLRGKIDLLVEPDGAGSWLVDYKSGAFSSERGGRYRLQMLLYAEAVERITGARPERALLHFLADGRGLEVALTAAARAEAAGVVRAFAAAHERDAFPAAPAPERCVPCEFQAACRFAVVR